MLAMACDVVECWAKGAGFQMCWDSLVYAFDVGRVQRIEEILRLPHGERFAFVGRVYGRPRWEKRR